MYLPNIYLNLFKCSLSVNHMVLTIVVKAGASAINLEIFSIFFWQMKGGPGIL